MIEAMLKNQGKLASRKQLYYALAQMFSAQVQHYKHCIQALEVVPDDVPDELMKGLIVQAFEAIAPLYRLSVALKNYGEQFGELPEFTKFIGHSLTPDAKEKGLIPILDKIMESALNMEKKWTRQAGKSCLFVKHAFGEDFVKQCEITKLKGEQ